MTTPLVDPGMAQNTLTEQQMQSLQREAEASRRSLNGGSVSKEKKLRQACEGFEAVFIQKMWEGMRASLPKEGMMHSREEQFWQGMYDQELGKSLASAGGVGLADMMVGQLSRNLQNASEVAANRNGRVPLDIAPVPLLPKAAPGTEKPAISKADKATGMYEGEAGQPDLPVTEQTAEAAQKLSAGQRGQATQAGSGTQAQTAGQAQAQAGEVSGQMPDQAAGQATATPAEVLGPLNEFAAQLGVPLVQAMAVSTAPAGQQADVIEPGLRAFGPGQKPTQSIDELAAALVAQAGRESGGPVNVTTTRQVNAANMASRNRVVRQRRNVPVVPSGSPVTGRDLAAGTPGQGIPDQNAQAAQNTQAVGQVGARRQGNNPITASGTATMTAPTAMRTAAPAARITPGQAMGQANVQPMGQVNAPANGQASTNAAHVSPQNARSVSPVTATAQPSPVNAPANAPTTGPTGGPTGVPAALRTFVDGLGLSGSELASNTTAARGRQSRRLAGSTGE